MAGRPDPILRFFLGERIHPNGRTIHEILNLEGPKMVGSTAGVIQWLFPLTTPSTHVPGAPTLSPAEVELFRTHPGLRKLYLRGINRFLERYGMAIHGDSALISSVEKIRSKWMYPGSHAFIPLTRILRSLKTLEFPVEFSTLRNLLFLCNEKGGGNLVDRSTLDIWKRV
jgi:hypothetical protein